LLETTGVLERALPELAEAFDRRRDDPFELDPTQTFRWALVDQLHDVLADDPAAAAEHQLLERPELLLLAALIADAAGDEGVVPTARRLVKRLDLGAAAEQEVALLVGETGLLRAAAARVDGLAEASVVQLAAHLGTPERARALYLLTLAAEGSSEVERRRVAELHDLIQQVLRDPKLSGRDARNLVEGKRAMAAGRISDPTVADRIACAPDAFVLGQDASELARRSALLEPLPTRGTLRVSVTPADDETWWIDVATRDQHGLLAGVTAGLASAGLDVEEAAVATWGDGGALEALRVRASAAPEPGELTRLLTAAIDAGRGSLANPEAEVHFDDEGSPWYTVCSIQCEDRPGLLHAFACGFAVAGASVHAARVSTAEGRVDDVFELTDRRGAKLDATTKSAIRAAIAAGVRSSGRRFGRRPRLVIAPPVPLSEPRAVVPQLGPQES
jgi:UTP:GlnB (protein PII) uridylyltransferase